MGASPGFRQSHPHITDDVRELYRTLDRLAAYPFEGGFRIVITGPHGFERTVMFAIDDDPAVIAERVRETVEE